MTTDRPDPTRDELLDHDADGIREFDNALPRWWLYGFYVTIVFAAVYMVNYHVLATPVFGQPGMAAEYRAEMAAVPRNVHAGRSPGAAGAPMRVVSDAAGLARGQALFESADNVCSSCHRPDLGGMVGPNLTDKYWIHGCSVGEIVTSIKTGYPQRGMLPFGTGKPLADGDIVLVASYILSKSGSVPASTKPIDPDRDKVCQ